MTDLTPDAVSAVLSNAGHDVADEVDVAEVSGFWVDLLPASWAPAAR